MDFELKWQLGPRTAALIVRLASGYASDITVSYGDETVSAKDIGGLMMLGQPLPKLGDIGLPVGSRVRVTAHGQDTDAAMGAITELFSCGTRVERCLQAACPLPPELIGYTRETISYACGKKGHDWTVSRADGTPLNQA